MINTAKEWLNTTQKGHQELVDYYNVHCLPLIDPSRKYRMSIGDNWCAMFTSCIAHMCGIGVSDFPYEVSVAQQVGTCKRRGWYCGKETKALPNDLIFFDWKGNGTFAHVGFVFTNDGRTITTVEGNHNGTVAFRTLSADSKFIAGYGRTPKGECEKGHNWGS